MKSKGIWLVPVVILSIPILHRFDLLINALKRAEEDRSNTFYRYFLESNLSDWSANILTVVLLFEMVVYFLIRKKITGVWPVLIHSLTLFVAFLVFPTLHKTRILLLSQKGIEVKHSEWIMLFLLPIIVGHVFFIVTIVKSFKKKKKIHEAPGRIDEFVS